MNEKNNELKSEEVKDVYIPNHMKKMIVFLTLKKELKRTKNKSTMSYIIENAKQAIAKYEFYLKDAAKHNETSMSTPLPKEFWLVVKAFKDLGEVETDKLLDDIVRNRKRYGISATTVTILRRAQETACDETFDFEI